MEFVALMPVVKLHQNRIIFQEIYMLTNDRSITGSLSNCSR